MKDAVDKVISSPISLNNHYLQVMSQTPTHSYSPSSSAIPPPPPLAQLPAWPPSRGGKLTSRQKVVGLRTNKLHEISIKDLSSISAISGPRNQIAA